MNKAFVREPDVPRDVRCPHCEIIGLPVGRATIEAHLPEEARRHLADANAFFCPNPRCPVGYFDIFEQNTAGEHFQNSVYPKYPNAPICSCFELYAQDVIQDARAGNASGVRLLIERSEGREALCRVCSPDGQCCVAQVQKLYLKHAEKDTPNG